MTSANRHGNAAPTRTGRAAPAPAAAGHAAPDPAGADRAAPAPAAAGHAAPDPLGADRAAPTPPGAGHAAPVWAGAGPATSAGAGEGPATLAGAGAGRAAPARAGAGHATPARAGVGHGEAALAGAGHAALVGTTASGKSALALALARRDPTVELVSVDSMQVYRRMDIGTAKPTPAERAEVPHHLLDLAEPWEDFAVADFQGAFRRALAGIEERGHRALLVGGTGLYLRALVDGLEIPGQFPDARAEVEAEPDTTALHARLRELDPVAAGRMEPTNRRRVVRALEVTLGSGRPFSSYGPGLEAYPQSPFRLVGVALPMDIVDARIAARYRQQVADGFVEECKALLADPRGVSRTAHQALGYKELFEHLSGDSTLADALDLAVRRTRRFARRQRSWFTRDPRITWFGADDPADLLGPVAGALHIG